MKSQTKKIYLFIVLASILVVVGSYIFGAEDIPPIWRNSKSITEIGER